MNVRFLRYLIFLALGILLVGCGGRKTRTVTKEKIDGYKGEAKMNPYLAAERFLEKVSGQEVKSRSGFVSYDHELGTVIAPASTLHSDVVTDKMLRWVADGGVYVCLIQRGEKSYVDVGEHCDHLSSSWRSPQSPELDYLLDQLRLELVNEPSGKTAGGKVYYDEPKDPVVLGNELPLALTKEVDIAGETLQMRIGGATALKVKQNAYNIIARDHAEKGGTHRFLGVQYGNGCVFFLTDARPLRNPYLGMHDHARILESILSYGYGDIVFTFNKRRGFWGLMAHYAWPALLALFVLLVLWLWKNMPRFGPLIDVNEAHSRDYLETVRNTGHFLWKHKRYDALLDPIRQQIYKRSGMFNHHGEASPELIETLSDSSGLEQDQVVEALSRNEQVDSQTMIRMSKHLQTILKSL